MVVYLKKYSKILIFIAFLVGVFFLYSYKINDPALGLYCDEADVGIHAASIAENLYDINGKFLPFLFESFRNFKFPVYIYPTALIVKFFGLSIYTTRILAVISAVMAIGFLYLISRRVFSLPVAIISSVFLTLTPGFFHLQRSAMGTHTFAGCYLGSIYFLIRYLESKTRFSFILFLIFVFLTWWSYAPSTVFVICSVVITIFFHVVEKRKISFKFLLNNKLKAFLLTVLAFVFLIFPITFGYKASHYANRALINHSIDELNSNDVSYYLNSYFPQAELIYKNSPKIIKEATIFLHHYYISYSPKFLFSRADANFRHIVPEKAPLPILFIFLLPIGFFVCVKEFKKLQYKYLLAAVLSIGIPSGMLIVNVELIHNQQMYPVFAVLAALGLVELVQVATNNKYLRSLYYLSATLFIVLSFVSYVSYYFGEYLEASSREWQAYRGKLIDYVYKNKDKYDKIYYSGQIHEFETSLVFFAKSKYGFKMEDYQEKQRKKPFNMDILDHTLYENNIQFDSLREYYGNNILLILNPLELPECKPIKLFYYKNDYSPDGKEPFAKLCEL